MSTTSFIRSLLSRTEASTACSASRLWGGTFTRGVSAAPCDVSLEPLIVPPFPGRWPLFRHHLDRDLGDHLRPRLALHLVLPDLLARLRPQHPLSGQRGARLVGALGGVAPRGPPATAPP